MLNRTGLAILLIFISVAGASFDLDAECSVEGEQLKWFKPFHINNGDFSNLSFVSLFNDSLVKLGQGNFGEVRLVNIKSQFNNPSNPVDFDLAVKELEVKKVKPEELDVHREINSHVYAPSLYLCQFDANKSKVYIVQEVIRKKLTEITTMVDIGSKSIKHQINLWATGIKALLHMHSKNLVHNDIKPENLMTDDTYNVIFLIDFGLAQRTTEPIKNIAGTPYFMNFRRNENLEMDIRNDLYAYVLSMGVAYSNYDAIFVNLDDEMHKKFGGDNRLCFQIPRSLRHHPIFNQHEVLEEACLKYMSLNLMSVLEPIFGPVKETENGDLDMGFTTLLLKIFNFKSSHITVEEIKAVVAHVTSSKFVPVTLEKEVKIGDDALQKSQQLYSEFAEFEKECEEVLNDEQAKKLEDDNRKRLRVNLFKKRKEIEEKQTEHLKNNQAVVENADLLKSQEIIERPNEIPIEVVEKYVLNMPGVEKPREHKLNIRPGLFLARMDSIEAQNRRRRLLEYLKKNRDEKKPVFKKFKTNIKIDGPQQKAIAAVDDYGMKMLKNNKSSDNLSGVNQKTRRPIFNNFVQDPKSETSQEENGKTDANKRKTSGQKIKLSNKFGPKFILNASKQPNNDPAKNIELRKSKPRIKLISKDSFRSSGGISSELKSPAISIRKELPPKDTMNNQELVEQARKIAKRYAGGNVEGQRRKPQISEYKTPHFYQPEQLILNANQPAQKKNLPRSTSLDVKLVPDKKAAPYMPNYVRPSNNIYTNPSINVPKRQITEVYSERENKFVREAPLTLPQNEGQYVPLRGNRRSHSNEVRNHFHYTAPNGFDLNRPSNLNYYKDQAVSNIYTNYGSIYPARNQIQEPLKRGIDPDYYGYINNPLVYRII